MPRGSEKADEFRRYQQALAVLYIGTISAGFLLLAASVVKELFFRPVGQSSDPVLSGKAPDPIDLLRCHNDVETLFRDLNRTSMQLLAAPLSHDRTAVLPGWETFSRAWLERWEQVDVACRFSERAGTHLGNAHAHLATTHRKLIAIQLQYQSLLARFDREQAADLAALQRALNVSRERIGTGSSTQGANREEAP